MTSYPPTLPSFRVTLYTIKSRPKIWWIQIFLRDRVRCSFQAMHAQLFVLRRENHRLPTSSSFPFLQFFIIRDCRAMRRETEKNIRDEIGEGQNAWQITRLVHRRNETKPRPRTRTALCSHCSRVSLRGSQVRHSAGATRSVGSPSDYAR